MRNSGQANFDSAKKGGSNLRSQVVSNRINKGTNSAHSISNGGSNTTSKSGFQGEVEGSTPKLERFKIRTIETGQVVKDDKQKLRIGASKVEYFSGLRKVIPGDGEWKDEGVDS
ncbi:hypothetical protein DITRI_Ditri12bG0139300 [Diplodiscus trichospermus]